MFVCVCEILGALHKSSKQQTNIELLLFWTHTCVWSPAHTETIWKHAFTLSIRWHVDVHVRLRASLPSTCPQPRAAHRVTTCCSPANLTGHPLGSGLTHISSILTVISLLRCYATATSVSPHPFSTHTNARQLGWRVTRQTAWHCPAYFYTCPYSFSTTACLPVCLASSRVWIAASLTVQPLIVWHAGLPLLHC